MQILYNLFIHLYTFLIRIAAIFNQKAAQWINGRKNWEALLASNLKEKQKNPVVWIHCASLGEFEQGRPIIELLKQKKPDCTIYLSFFSPSGYEIRKNYPLADHVFYLPPDTPRNAQKLVQLLQVDLAIFVKYEFWLNYLQSLFQHKVPTLLVSALFRPNQHFFKWYGYKFRQLLPQFYQIFLQNQHSAQLLQKLDLKNIQTTGDTRIDRVLKIAEEAKTFPLVQQFVGNQKVLVIGSSWGLDEAILAPVIHQAKFDDWKFIFAPHQINNASLLALEKKLKLPFIRYSQLAKDKLSTSRVLIIDNIGMLSSIYKYGDIAYIGGGFGSGIHNTLEPIAFGLPVIFGPKYQKFEEAQFLVNQGGGFSVNKSKELGSIFEQLLDTSVYKKASLTAKSYIDQNKGASHKVLEEILKIIE